MNLCIRKKGFKKVDRKLLDEIREKVAKLTKLYERIIHVDVSLTVDNVVHRIKDKVIKIKVTVPGQEFFAKATFKTFEKSLDEAMDAITIQIQKINIIRKEKRHQLAAA